MIPDSQALHNSRHRWRLILLLLILLLGWLLRTSDLDERSLWADEGWTMLLSAGPGLDDVAQTMAEDQHPPLFFMAFRLWRDVAGDSEFAGRYFSVLISMIAVAAIYQLGRELYGVWVGVLAALVLALADLPIDLAQEVRHYALLATLSVLSTLFYVRWRRVSTRANRVGYVLLSIALIYTHYLGGYALVAQLLHMLLTVRPWRRLREALLLFGSVCLAFVPWFVVFLEQNRVRWDNPLYYQNALPNSMDTYRMVRTALLGQHYVLFALLILLGLVYLRYRHGNGQTRVHLAWQPVWPGLLLVIWIALMVGLTVYINAQREFLTVRNFVIIMPPLVLLAAHGLANLERTAQGFMIVLIVVISLTTVDARRQYPNWRAVTQNVTRYHLDNEPVLMDVWVGDFPVRYYVRQQMGADTPAISLREWRDEYRGDFVPAVLDYIQDYDAFWLVYWGDTPMGELGELIDLAGFQRTAALSVDHLGTPLYSYRYDRLGDDTLATFGDLFALHKFHAPEQVASGDTIRVTLWWTVLQTPPLDYSVSVFVLDANEALVTQHDGPPLDGTEPTSTWQPDMLKYDIHRVPLRDVYGSPLPPGEYQIGVRVYWYGDQVPLPVDADTDYVLLGTLNVQ